MGFQDQLNKVREAGPRAGVFLSEVWAELKKVHWPTRRETYAATLVVLFVTVLVATFLGMIDFAISHVVRAVLS